MLGKKYWAKITELLMADDVAKTLSFYNDICATQSAISASMKDTWECKLFDIRVQKLGDCVFTFVAQESFPPHMRAVAPLAIGTAGGGLTLWWWLREVTSDLAHQLVTSAARGLILGLVPQPDFTHWLDAAWYLGGALICWELRYELLELLKFFLIFGIRLVHTLIWIHHLIRVWISVASAEQCGPPGLPRTERDSNLTCMAANAGPGHQVGSLLLVSRPPNWDEIWVAGCSPDGSELVCRTTTADGGAWAWVIVRPIPMSVVSPVGGGVARRAPPGVAQASVNWLCTPPNCDQQWDPDAIEVVNLTREANQFLTYMQSNAGVLPVNQAGVAGPLIEVNLPAPPLGPGGLGVGGGVGNPAAAGLGLPAGGDGAAPSNAELKALEAAVAQLQQLALDRGKDKKEKDKGKKHRKSKKRSKKSKKKKKKSKRSSSSRSSTSRSSRSRSASTSSSSSSSSGKSKPLRWKQHGRDQKVTYSDLAHVDQLRLKKRGDLLAFAAKSPGALTAHFLVWIYARLSKGSISRSSQLREASAVSWAHQFSGLTEVRDQKEVLTLCEILDHVNRKEISRALDVLCQRIVAIQQAKVKGGSWEKAEALELVTNQRSLAASSMLALTNA
eukprot:s313_g4.t1